MLKPFIFNGSRKMQYLKQHLNNKQQQRNSII
jgi:hypothetical protein